MARRTPTAALVVASLLVTACGTTSNIDRSAAVSVTGRLTAQSDVADRPVLLYEDLRPEDAVTGTFAAMASMGTVCLLPAEDDRPDICQDRGWSASTDDEGRYRFDLDGADVQSSFGIATVLRLSSSLERVDETHHLGALSQQSFNVQVEALELPDLHFWEVPPTVRAASGLHHVEWAPAPAEVIEDPTYLLEVTDARGQQVWRIDEPAAVVAIDDRVFEDTSGGIAIVAHTEGAITGSTMDTDLRTPQPAYSGPGAPPSRGVGCTTTTDRGQRVDHQPCAVTDGDFATTLATQEVAACPVAERATAADCEVRVTLDLGEVRSLDIVVVRGSGEHEIETSLDGQTWVPSGTAVAGGVGAIVTFPDAITARYVRVTPRFGVVLGLTEVSVW